MDNNKIFISYSYEDHQVAEEIYQRLFNEGLDVLIDQAEISPGESIFEQLKYKLESSETVLLLLSKNLLESDFFQYEYSTELFSETRKRKVSLIPVLLEKCDLPNELLELESIKLYRNFERGIKRIIRKIRYLPRISFEDFTHPEFEHFVYDLLKEYRFKNIREEAFFDDRIDFHAEYISKNPFGIKRKEKWLIEIKYYKEERFSISSINNLIDYYRSFDKKHANLLLITNSQLTSIAEEYLQEAKDQGINIDLIDGLTLKKIVERRKRLIRKYFSE